MKFVAKYLLIGLMLISNVCNAEIILRFQPVITKHASKLGDILNIQSTIDPHSGKQNLCKKNQCADWANIPLQSHPTPGEIITREMIIDWMTQRIGHIDITWQGKTQITVQKPTQSSADMLIEKAKNTLIHQLQPHYLRIDVASISKINGSEYAIDNFKTELETRVPTATRVCVWLVNKKTRIPVWFKVNAYAQVLVANRDLPSNYLIQPSDISLQERNIAGLSALPATSFSPNLWLKSSIKRDQIVRTNQLKAAPLVIKGRHIKVATHNHRITVVMDAIALADGYLGEIITVRNPINQKTFHVKLTGAQQAELAS